MPTDGILQ